MFDVSQRTKDLGQLFSLGKRVQLEESNLEILSCQFNQTLNEGEINAFQQDLETTDFCPSPDYSILENKSFTYPIFQPKGRRKSDQAIILLHGLNERSWVKYLPWAEYLASSTGKMVLLFPIAFHMNRTPSSWYNPRELMSWVKRRKEWVKDCTNSTFVNLALSNRLSGHPLRFYASGRESAFNLCQLVREIKSGRHPYLNEGASVDIFAYSIGALLSQVLLLANPGDMFSESKLFMFCGGSVFSHMNGNARDIMDKDAYDRLYNYFINDFLKEDSLPKSFPADGLEKAFKSMIATEKYPVFRESFFLKACERIRAISLKNDVVMPTQGIIKALGKASGKILGELDFPFAYSHQRPFPIGSDKEAGAVNEAFSYVFSRAVNMLS